MSENLLYKPNLTYEKNYYTDGKLYENGSLQDLDINDMSSKPIDRIDQLDELKNQIIEKLPMMPEHIVESFLPPFYIISGMIEDLQNNKDNHPKLPETEPPTTVPVKPGGGEDNVEDELEDVPDDPFDIESDDEFINIKIEDIPIEDELEIEYIRDLTDIFKDYLQKYNMTFEKYINSVVANFSMSKHKNIKTIETKDISSESDLSHLSDFVTKSKIIIEQKTRLANKLFDLDETIFHIRATKVANEQRKRYYTNKKMEDKNALSKMSNDLLKESKMISQKKYEENFYALYKYLNSSVILLNECITAEAKQRSALITLNNEERE